MEISVGSLLLVSFIGFVVSLVIEAKEQVKESRTGKSWYAFWLVMCLLLGAFTVIAFIGEVIILVGQQL